MPNPGMKLKPDMFVSAIIRVPLGSSIVVPVTAVIDTGKRKVVWVETAQGMFEPRNVQVGQQSDDKIQILSGIKSGDKVAVSGGYLIDSESQLKGGGGQDHSQHGGTAKLPPVPLPGPPPLPDQAGGHEGHGAQPPVKPAPAKKGGNLNMDDMKM
jgi:Cu(I)/Ag(I) efflux system membrane fusion protein